MSNGHTTSIRSLAGALQLHRTILDDTAPSWQSRCITGLSRLLPIRKRTASAAAVQAYVQKRASGPATYQPRGLGAGVTVAMDPVDGWPVYRVEPLDDRRSANTVVFLHGGGHVKEITKAHWRFVGHLARAAGVRCVVPIYPLAPQGTAGEIVPAVGRLLGCLIGDAGTAKVTVVGNSAGAGMALAAAQWLRERGQRQPEGLVLISPGLDASIGRAWQQTLALRDPTQDIPGIREGARLYAGELEVTHPYVSPLRGDLRGLAPMLVFSGTLDLLYPDAVELAARARAVGVPVQLHLKRGQPHNYAGLPTPEGREARALIARAVNEGLA